MDLVSKDPLLGKLSKFKVVEHDSLLNNTNEEVLTHKQKSYAIDAFKDDLKKPMHKSLYKRRTLIELVRLESDEKMVTSDSCEDDDNDENDNKTLYGFEKGTFLRVLFQKAREKYPGVEPSQIYMQYIPEVLEELYLQMDDGNEEVN